MTTPTTQRQPLKLEYDLTVGMSVMEGRGFYYPSDATIASNGRLYVANRSVDGVDRGVRVTVCVTSKASITAHSGRPAMAKGSSSGYPA